MICRSVQPWFWVRKWARRLGIVAAIVTILAGIPGVVATILFFANSYWPEPPKLLPPPPSRPIASRPGPGAGRCPEYHAFREGRCQDVRLRDKEFGGPRS